MRMLNHLRNFIPNVADLSDPLCKLLRKGSVWVWGESQQKAFEQLKQALVSITITIQTAQRSLLRYYFKLRMMESAAHFVTRQDLSVI